MEAKQQTDKPRATWSNQLEFILTCVGYAVGLGNVWRFPYLCYKNGGGVFLIPYFICLLLLGIPIFYLEIGLGQFASSGPIKLWNLNPALQGLGIAMTTISYIISIYYCIVIAYCLHFFFASMTSNLPWTTCDNDWNTCDCRDGNQNETSTDPWEGSRPECVNYTPPNVTSSASSEYFYRKVIKMSDAIDNTGEVKWDLVLCNLLAWLIVFIVLSKGIKSLGKVVYFTAIFPYLLLTVLLVRGLTLDGYYDGIMYYLTPDWSKLSDSNVWSDAATQIFYSLSTCAGGLIALASYNTFNNFSLRDALLVPIINCLTSFYAGFAIFSVLGFMAWSKGVSVDNVATGGPGLIFVVYPEGLAQMPVPALWSILFFFMMITLGFSSLFSLVETVITSLLDKFGNVFDTKWRKIGFRFAICVLGFILGLPMLSEGGFYLFNLVDTYVSGFPLLFIGLLELIAVAYVYGFANFKGDLEMMYGKSLGITISFYFFGPLWCVISPLALLAVIIAKCIQFKPTSLGPYIYPSWAEALGWLIVIAILISVPIWYLYYACRHGLLKLCCLINRPSEDWGPALPENRTSPRYSHGSHVTNGKVTSSDDSYTKTPSYNVHVNDGYDSTSEQPDKAVKF